jgi:hypothetical protein
VDELRCSGRSKYLQWDSFIDNTSMYSESRATVVYRTYRMAPCHRLFCPQCKIKVLEVFCTSPKPGPWFPCHRLFCPQCVKVLVVFCTSPKPGPGFLY